MFGRLLTYLEESQKTFNVVHDKARMEIWIQGKEWLPILISQVDRHHYRIAWGSVLYLHVSADKGLAYVLNICRQCNQPFIIANRRPRPCKALLSHLIAVVLPKPDPTRC